MIEPFLVSIIIFLVAIISLSLCVIGLLAFKRTRDVRLLSLTLAFGIFFIKNLITGIAYEYDVILHGDLELFNAVLDFFAMIFLIIPIFKKPQPKLVEVLDA